MEKVVSQFALDKLPKHLLDFPEMSRFIPLKVGFFLGEFRHNFCTQKKGRTDHATESIWMEWISPSPNMTQKRFGLGELS